jgi:hypothetical protein
MNRIIRVVLAGLLVVISLSPVPSFADNRDHHRAMKICKQKYRDAVRGAKYLRGHQRRLRLEQARRERAECEKLTPR